MELTFTQLDWLTTRARHLQRSMTTFYLALGLFVATTVTLGFVGLTGKSGKAFQWIPVVFGMIGAGLLFWGTILLAFEATLALRSVHSEMDFLWKLGKHYAPDPLQQRLGVAAVPFLHARNRWTAASRSVAPGATSARHLAVEFYHGCSAVTVPRAGPMQRRPWPPRGDQRIAPFAPDAVWRAARNHA